MKLDFSIGIKPINNGYIVSSDYFERDTYKETLEGAIDCAKLELVDLITKLEELRGIKLNPKEFNNKCVMCGK